MSGSDRSRTVRFAWNPGWQFELRLGQDRRGMGYRFERVEEPGPDGVEVGWFATSQEAKERMLVLLALGLESWIEPHGRAFSLRVRPDDESAALRALADDARDATRLIQPAPPLPLPGSWDVFWMVVAALVLSGIHVLAVRNPGLWRDNGVADSLRIIADGEWHRAFTALCLHSDLSHLAANLLFGGLFLWFLSPRLGAGVAWLLVVSAGVAGNLANAFLYGNQGHRSLGASTAVFGGLGVLVGLEMVAALRGRGWRPIRRMILPLGAGLALLAWLGTEGEQTDILAHLWGFVAGLGLGLVYGGCGERLAALWVRVVAGAGVWIALVAAWAQAWGG